jgi:hypothetical protein
MPTKITPKQMIPAASQRLGLTGSLKTTLDIMITRT